MAVALSALLGACGTDPGADLAPDQTELEKLVDWMEVWDDEADVYSRVWVAFVKDAAASGTEVTFAKVHQWGTSLNQAAGQLQAGIAKAGSLESTFSPTYEDALSATTIEVMTAADKLSTCRTSCEGDLGVVVSNGSALESLVIKTAAVNVTPATVTRTSSITDSLPADDEDGRIPFGDRVDPATYLCQPEFEKSDVLAGLTEPTNKAQTAFGTVDRIPTFHEILQWDYPPDAARYFETLQVRAITCEPHQEQDQGFTDTWELEDPPPMSVHTFGWRGESSDGEDTLYSHGVAALVDDVVVTVLVLSAVEPPAQDIAEGLLRDTISSLGVVPEKPESP